MSIFILAFGLLGVASLIPLGKLSLAQVNIADRTGACGRAAMRDVQVRRMLNYGNWYDSSGVAVPFNAAPGAIVLDPMYFSVNHDLPNLGGIVPRCTFTGLVQSSPSPTQAQLDVAADAIFRLGDELVFVMPKDMNPPQQGDRPVPAVVGGQSAGNFSWFLTVCPSPSDIDMGIMVGLRRDYTVSVVVCHRRNFAPRFQWESRGRVRHHHSGPISRRRIRRRDHPDSIRPTRAC